MRIPSVSPPFRMKFIRNAPRQAEMEFGKSNVSSPCTPPRQEKSGCLPRQGSDLHSVPSLEKQSARNPEGLALNDAWSFWMFRAISFETKTLLRQKAKQSQPRLHRPDSPHTQRCAFSAWGWMDSCAEVAWRAVAFAPWAA